MLGDPCSTSERVGNGRSCCQCCWGLSWNPDGSGILWSMSTFLLNGGDSNSEAGSGLGWWKLCCCGETTGEDGLALWWMICTGGDLGGSCWKWREGDRDLWWVKTGEWGRGWVTGDCGRRYCCWYGGGDLDLRCIKWDGGERDRLWGGNSGREAGGGGE